MGDFCGVLQKSRMVPKKGRDIPEGDPEGLCTSHWWILVLLGLFQICLVFPEKINLISLRRSNH